MVCGGLRWRFCLHSDPAGPAGGLCTLLERVLGGKDGDWQPQGLVCRSVTETVAHLHAAAVLQYLAAFEQKV